MLPQIIEVIRKPEIKEADDKGEDRILASQKQRIEAQEIEEIEILDLEWSLIDQIGEFEEIEIKDVFNFNQAEYED